MNLHQKNATELALLLKDKKVSAKEVFTDFQNQIEKNNPEINAYISVVKDAEIDAAPSGTLAGIPVAIKDNVSTRDVITTCASKMLENYTPIFDATVMEKLSAAGAVMLGKTNMDEFAMGSSGESSYFGAAKNPWDTTRVAGGSSSGSAAAVAAFMAPFAIASDTGGSVRIPASYCGLVGLKPTYGAVSRFGIASLAASFDQIGPIARTVSDTELLFKAICGKDEKDSTSAEYSYKSLDVQLEGLRIGLVKEGFGENINAEVKSSVLGAVEVLKGMGASVSEVSLPFMKYASAVFSVINSCETVSSFGKFDGIKYGFADGFGKSLDEFYKETRAGGFGAGVKSRILLGAHFLSSECYEGYYKKAMVLKQQISEDMATVFEKYDVLIMPTAPTTAYKLGKYKGSSDKMPENDVNTVVANIAGVPAMTIPCGFDKENMPIGIQLMGGYFAENMLFSLAKKYEDAVGGFACKEEYK